MQESNPLSLQKVKRRFDKAGKVLKIQQAVKQKMIAANLSNLAKNLKPIFDDDALKAQEEKISQSLKSRQNCRDYINEKTKNPIRDSRPLKIQRKLGLIPAIK